jgi:hypothetical protein
MVLFLVSWRNFMAQADALPAHALTLEEAFEYAQAHYPAIRAALEEVNSARSGGLGARGRVGRRTIQNQSLSLQHLHATRGVLQSFSA